MYKKWSGLLLLGVLGAITWRYVTYVDPEDQAYYTGVLCSVVAQQSDNYTERMRNIVEGSNNDYALQRIKFNQTAADKVIKSWEKLPTADKNKLAQDTNACQHALTAQ